MVSNITEGSSTAQIGDRGGDAECVIWIAKLNSFVLFFHV